MYRQATTWCQSNISGAWTAPQSNAPLLTGDTKLDQQRGHVTSVRGEPALLNIVEASASSQSRRLPLAHLESAPIAPAKARCVAAERSALTAGSSAFSSSPAGFCSVGAGSRIVSATTTRAAPVRVFSPTPALGSG